MKKIVLTGGPCAGKSTILNALENLFLNEICIIPEAATILFENGYPVPGIDIEWSEEWQKGFQEAIFNLQIELERKVETQNSNNFKLVICDRGILDGAAYTPGGSQAFCKTHGISEIDANNRYEMIIHLESLAVNNPTLYGKAGNNTRFETVDRAVELDLHTRKAWGSHPNHIIIGGKQDIEIVKARVIAILGL